MAVVLWLLSSLSTFAQVTSYERFGTWRYFHIRGGAGEMV